MSIYQQSQLQGRTLLTGPPFNDRDADSLCFSALSLIAEILFNKW